MHANVDYLLSKGWQYKESRGELTGKCPNRDHKDKNPSFGINSSTGQFKCFSCGFKGSSLVTLMMGVEGLSREEASDRVFGTMEVELEVSDKTIYNGIMTEAQRWFTSAIKAQKEPLKTSAYNAREYLRTRGITDDIIAKYNIGYSHDNIVKYLSGKGMYNELSRLTQFLADGSYICGDRITVPVYNRNVLIGFSMRSLNKKADRKYLNLINADLYPSKKWFFNLDNCTTDTLLLTEGVFDAIAVNGAAMLGTALSPERLELLYRYKNIYLLFDNDAGGWKAVEDFYFYSKGILTKSVVKVCNLPCDPDECVDSIGTYVDNALPITHWIARRTASHRNPEVMCNEVRRIHERADNCYEMNEIERKLLDQYLLVECALMRFSPKLWGGDGEWSRAWSEMALEVEKMTGIKFTGVQDGNKREDNQ